MSTGEWLNREQAAAHVGATVRAFDHWVASRGVRATGRRGRIRLWKREDLDRVLRSDATVTSRRLRAVPSVGARARAAVGDGGAAVGREDGTVREQKVG